MTNIIMNTETANTLYHEALQAKGEHPSYREGYLDAYNKVKTLTIIQEPKVYCCAKEQINKPDGYVDCDCHNFCKFDGIQFDTDLA